MKTLDICPQHIFQFTADESLRQEAETLVEKEGYESNARNYVTIEKNLAVKPGYNKLVTWFESCVEQVRKTYEYQCEKLTISQMWANKADNNNWHHMHNHPFSIISAIFYITDSPAKTWFSVGDFWLSNYTSIPLRLADGSQKDPYIIHKQPSVKGTLLLFPSHLMHSVDEHKGEKPRYTISFNTFPAGVVGNINGLQSVIIPS